MVEQTHPEAGRPLPQSRLLDPAALLRAYHELQPDPEDRNQGVRFGTSGHRGVAFKGSFNEWHVLAISQAICDWRRQAGVDGPLYMGFDTHAVSRPAFDSALQVLAANGVQLKIASGDEYTPTPAISHAIVSDNRERDTGMADGIVITPSHNPPEHGGFKYNPPHGGAADTATTQWIQARANHYLACKLDGVQRVSTEHARRASTTNEHDFLQHYVEDLQQAVDLDCIRHSGIRLAVDPLGGAGVHYWAAIAAHYQLDLTVVSEAVDPRFAFMTADWDGQIRMDPSSPWAMQRLLALRDRFDLAFACDTDHDRHGIVTPTGGLMPANDYLSVLAWHLLKNRPQWADSMAVGKTAVTTAMLDKITAGLDRSLYETPVGFKWFAPGLADGSLGFACEESAGASLARRDGLAWVTDKDGMTAALLAAEITARHGRDPAVLYQQLQQEHGPCLNTRVDAPANAAQRRALNALEPSRLQTLLPQLAGSRIQSVTSTAQGNGQPIGGIKVSTGKGWFAARPSGTEDIYKIYAESFDSTAHLQQIIADAQAALQQVFAGH